MKTRLKTMMGAVAVLLLGAQLAGAQENNFPIDPNVDGPIKVKWRVTDTGGVVLAGQNASGTPLTVQHVKDGNSRGVERHPIFKVIGKSNRPDVAFTLPTVQIEDNNGTGVALRMGRGRNSNHWSIVVHPNNTLLLREQVSFTNQWASVRFYVLTEGFVDTSSDPVPAGAEVCPESLIAATAGDIKDLGGTRFQYALNNVIVRSCDDVSRLGQDTPVI